jgi:REP element-mobilizing transposase RayT
VKELKRGSNLWFQERFPHIVKFAWQAGYGAFSVSTSNLEAVRMYIANQSEHHANVSF